MSSVSFGRLAGAAPRRVVPGPAWVRSGAGSAGVCPARQTWAASDPARAISLGLCETRRRDRSGVADTGNSQDASSTRRRRSATPLVWSQAAGVVQEHALQW